MLAYAKAIGANTDVVTAQAFAFPKEDNPGELLVILVAGVGEDGFATIRRVGLETQEHFFESTSTGEAFEKTSQFIQNELSSLEQFCAVIGFIEKETLYIETINQFTVLLRRGNQTIELTRGLEGEKLISGMLQVGDRILFLNPPQTTDLETNLLSSSLENLEFEIEAFLQQSPKSDPVAAVLVEIQKPEVEDQPQDTSSLENSEQKISPIRLDGARAKTPSLFLLLGSLLQKIPPPSKKRLIMLAVIIATLTFGGLFLKNYLSLKTQTKLPTVSPAPANNSDVVDFPTFLDLNLIKENFAASRLSMSLGRMAVLDNNTKSLVAIDMAQKNPQILAGQLQLGDAQFASINGDYIYVFSKDKGISKVDAGNGKVTVEVKSDGEWQRIVDIYGFANNVYLLDEFKNQIWKYIATDKGFSDRNQYLREGEVADFAAARNIQIDGSVWILKSDNTILKFTQGGKDFFQLGEIEPSLDKIKNFYISDETDNIYFLDNENSRVVVTNKKGEYVSQYSGEKFKTGVDLVVDEKGKKLYLLEGGKIYQIDLK